MNKIANFLENILKLFENDVVDQWNGETGILS